MIVNGSSAYEFDIIEGVRQGNPFSPCPFMLDMEGLNFFDEIDKREIYLTVNSQLGLYSWLWALFHPLQLLRCPSRCEYEPQEKLETEHREIPSNTLRLEG
uniref:Reverse transcriptase domain-containing protein n=1 Tax=Lactuca sativa TaxID=4236 RepID=A0A9R1VY91_LACSA|nr:hypothetical protein LSAT_V11C300109370 [Lactuca sativa]